MLVLASITLGPAGEAMGQCPAPGDCRSPRSTPGCEMPDCCALVCEADFLCCEIAWSEDCVKLALDLCDGINCPARGSCEATHASPGCRDFACCDLVSALDGWCEFAAWDEPCALEGSILCGVARCRVSIPDGALDEEEPCYERLNDGCSLPTAGPRLPILCGLARTGRIVGGAPRDLDWFDLDGSKRRRIRLTVEAELPLEVQHVVGDCEGPNTTRWLLGIAPCSGPTTFSFLVGTGVSSLVLGPGTSLRGIRSGLDCPELDPDQPPGPEDPPPDVRFGLVWVASFDCLAIADVDGDGAIGALDLAQLLSAWGPVDAGLEIDPRTPDADLDGDGAIGAIDLAILLAEW